MVSSAKKKPQPAESEGGNIGSFVNSEHTRDRFLDLINEYTRYHKGEVTHPQTGELMSQEAARNLYVKERADKLKVEYIGNIEDKRNPEQLRDAVHKLAERGFLLNSGQYEVKEDGSKKIITPKNKEELERRVRRFIESVASQALHREVSYEEAMDEILNAPRYWDPKREEEASKVLQALYSAVASEEHPDITKISDLERRLSSVYFQPQWEDKYKDNLKDLDKREHVKQSKLAVRKNTQPSDYLRLFKIGLITGELPVHDKVFAYKHTVKAPAGTAPDAEKTEYQPKH